MKHKPAKAAVESLKEQAEDTVRFLTGKLQVKVLAIAEGGSNTGFPLLCGVTSLSTSKTKRQQTAH